MPPTPVDPWTGFLQWLSTILIPDWNGLIALLPLVIIVGVTGPALSLLLLYWVYNRAREKSGKVRLDDPQPIALAANADGSYTYPANVPYCPTHHLLFPPSAHECDVDRGDLLVRCPVDDTVRPAGQQLCRSCGTRYQLGASLTPVVVRKTGTPPAGGAAVA